MTDKSVGHISEALVLMCLIICITVYCTSGEHQKKQAEADRKATGAGK